MSALPSDPQLRGVGRFWAAVQARNWSALRSLLKDDAQCHWWATRERFESAGALVQVNADYPEGWVIHLLALHRLGDGWVLSLVRVDLAERAYWAHSYFQIEPEGICAIDEYWCDEAEPPDWRKGMAQRNVPDARPGMSLDPALWA